MRTVPYSTVEKHVATRMGWDATNLSSDEREAIRLALNESARWLWTADWWPDLMERRQVALRPEWNLPYVQEVGSFTQGTQIYFPDAGRYYMAITTVTAEPPASYDGEEWVATGTRWVELKPDYPEATFWEPNVEYPDTDYSTSSVFSHAGRFWLPKESWFASSNLNKSPTYYPDEWIELPVFDNILPNAAIGRPMIGTFKRATRNNPMTVTAPVDIDWDQVRDGVQLYDFTDPTLWVEYRMANPGFEGDLYDETATYAAIPVSESLYGSGSMVELNPEVPTVATPVISPSSGTFVGSQLVTITCSTAGATIMVTTDGSAPTESNGTEYLAPFTVSATTTVKARAFRNGYTASGTASVTLTRALLMYWGMSTETMLDEAGILALEDSAGATTPARTYTFDVPTGTYQYLYWAWPDALTARPVVSTGFTNNGLSMTGTLAGSSDGYTSLENGFNYALVSVNGSSYRLYRTRLQQGNLGGTITVVINAN